MKQEAVEVDMEFFSKHVGPYFTWLESKIESGWEQSDSVQKDVLKEVRYVSTNMRARFILGVSREDFVKEAARTLELLELAAEAFPGESDEIETKIKFFSRAIANELGENVLPAKYRGMKSEVSAEVKMAPVETVKPAVKVDAPKPVVKIETPKTESPVVTKTPVAPKVPIVAVKTPAVKTAAPKVEKTAPVVKIKTEMKKMVEKKTAVEKKAAVVKKPVSTKKPAVEKKQTPVKKQETPRKNGKDKKPLVEWSKVKAWVLENLPKRF